ncbi:MAG: right-handed parallel beta-helix repeat-containing protein, partial [Candidatus Hodarchaeota archaeon]
YSVENKLLGAINVNNRYKLALAIIVFCSIFSSCFSNRALTGTRNEIIPLDEPSRSSPHPAIDIRNNTALAAFPGITGNGTAGNPYVIKDLEITINSSTNCIYIQDIDMHLTIQNCTLNNTNYIDGYGLLIQNCTNLKVINCTISNFYYGIYTFNSSNASFDNNSLVNNYHSIKFVASPLNNITQCNVTDGYYNGILIENSDNVTIMENNVSQINYPFNYGITLYSSDYLQISSNTVSENSGGGIRTESSHNCSVTGNVVSNNNRNGFYLYNCINLTCENNNVSNNTSGNFYMYNPCNTTMRNNTLVGTGFLFSDSTSKSKLMTNDFDMSNTINNKSLQFLVNKTGLGPVNYTDPGQLILLNCSDSEISGFNNISGFAGINVFYSNNTNISMNSFSSSGGYGIHVLGSNATRLENNTVEGASWDGFSLYGSDNTWMVQNNASNSGESGIRLNQVENATVTENEITFNSKDGLRLYYSDNVILDGNNISFNGFDGVYCSQSPVTNISGNDIHDNNIRGIYIYFSDNCSIIENDIYNNAHDGIQTQSFNQGEINDNNISQNGEVGLCLGNSDNNVIENNHVSGNGEYGIETWWFYDNNLTGNTISFNNGHGIKMYGSYDNNLTGNTISSNNGHGIELNQCDRNVLDNNHVSGHGGHGIETYWAHYNNFTGNNISSNNGNGIELDSSYNNLITNNHISYNLISGIYLHNSYYNEISFNTMYYNEDECIEEEGSSSNDIHDNDCKYSQRWINEHVITPIVKITATIAIIAIVIAVYVKQAPRIHKFITKPGRDVPLHLELKRVEPLMEKNSFIVPRMAEMAGISAVGTIVSLLFWQYGQYFPVEKIDIVNFAKYLFIAFMGIWIVSIYGFRTRNAKLLAGLRWVNGALAAWCFIYFMSYTFWQLYIIRYGYGVLGAALLTIAFPGSTPYMEFPVYGIILPDGDYFLFNFTVTCAHPSIWAIPVGIILFYPGMSRKSKARKNLAFLLVDHLVYELCIFVQKILYYYTYLSWDDVHSSATTAAIMTLIGIVWRIFIVWYLFPDVRTYAKMGYAYLKKRMKKVPSKPT